jgi:hypothetical protein
VSLPIHRETVSDDGLEPRGSTERASTLGARPGGAKETRSAITGGVAGAAVGAVVGGPVGAVVGGTLGATSGAAAGTGAALEDPPERT